MPDGEDIVELTGAASPMRGATQPQAPQGRPYLRLFFRCANQYARAYRNASGDRYLGRCPTCGKTISFVVGTGGTSERFFQLSCR